MHRGVTVESSEGLPILIGRNPGQGLLGEAPLEWPFGVIAANSPNSLALTVAM